MNARILQKIDLLTIAIGTLMAVIFYFWQGMGPAVSVLMGCAMGMLNFISQRMITARMVRQAATGAHGGLPAPLLFVLKYVVAGVAIYMVMRIERIDVIGFAAGFFSYMVAIIAVGGMPRTIATSDMDAATPASDSPVD